MWEWITTNLTHIDFSAHTIEQLLAAIRASFAGFEAGAPLIKAMLHTPQGLAIRKKQQPVRRAMFEACADDAVPDAPAEVRRRVAAALQILYSATAWEALQQFWDMDTTEATNVVQLAVTAMIAGLRNP